MKPSKLHITVSLLLLYAALNIMFLLKYVPRAGVSEALVSLAWIVVAGATIALAALMMRKSKERAAMWLTAALTGVMIGMIAVALVKIDPLSVRVDRWSATTYFLDALFSGQYPYGVHTHVSENNFPSPLPFWHYLNIPFYLLGDVGWQLVAFLLLAVVAVWWYTGSWKPTFLFTLLFALSPAYWWEVAVRSDGLSNMLLVFCFVLLVQKKDIGFGNRWWLLALLCGLLATTRLSAVMPLALLLFRPYLTSGWKKMLLFPLIVLAVVFLLFVPYIFWDTDSWIFFSRNPFMSQTSTGSGWVLMMFVALGMLVALLWRTMADYMAAAAWFMFLFMIVSITVVWITSIPRLPFFENPDCDISYLTLALPFAAFAITDGLQQRTYS